MYFSQRVAERLKGELKAALAEAERAQAANRPNQVQPGDQVFTEYCVNGDRGKPLVRVQHIFGSYAATAGLITVAFPGEENMDKEMRLQRSDEDWDAPERQETPEYLNVIFYKGSQFFVTCDPTDPADALYRTIYEFITKKLGNLKFNQDETGEIIGIEGTPTRVAAEHLRFANNVAKAFSPKHVQRTSNAKAIDVDAESVNMNNHDDDALVEAMDMMEREIFIRPGQSKALAALLKNLFANKLESLCTPKDLLDAKIKTSQVEETIAKQVTFRFKVIPAATPKDKPTVITKGDPSGKALELFKVCLKNHQFALCDLLMVAITRLYKELSHATLQEAVELLSAVADAIQYGNSFADEEEIKEYIDLLESESLKLIERNSFKKNEDVVVLSKTSIAVSLALDNTAPFHGGIPTQEEAAAHRSSFYLNFVTYFHLAQCVVDFVPISKITTVASLRKALLLDKTAPNQIGAVEVPIETTAARLYAKAFPSSGEKPKTADWQNFKLRCNRWDTKTSIDAAPVKLSGPAPNATSAQTSAPSAKSSHPAGNKNTSHGQKGSTQQNKSGGGSASDGKVGKVQFGPPAAKPGPGKQLSNALKNAGYSNKERKRIEYEARQKKRQDGYNGKRQAPQRRGRHTGSDTDADSNDS